MNNKRIKLLILGSLTLSGLILGSCSFNFSATTSNEQTSNSENIDNSDDETEETSSDVHAHTYDDGVITTDPTCTTNGVKTYTCTICGETKIESIKALGHTLTKVDAVTPTCTDDGNIEYYKCSTCNKYYSDSVATLEIKENSIVINKLGHNFDDNYICDRCDKTLEISDGLL